MVIARYHPPNYWDYQSWLQRTCLEIMQQFEAEGIDFAFPSRTIYIVGEVASLFFSRMTVPILYFLDKRWESAHPASFSAAKA